MADQRQTIFQSIMDGKSIPAFFWDRRNDRENEVAFLYKDLGIYNEVRWKQYWTEVEEFSLGLIKIGLSPGDRVAIMGDPCPEWFYSDLAVLSAGAISYGVYSTSSPEEICYTIEKTRAKFFIAENQEYVDKIVNFIERYTFLLNLIVIDTKAMFGYQNSKLITFKEVQKLGRELKSQDPGLFLTRLNKVKGDAPAFLVFTSGTTGAAKPAIITHKNILASLVYATSEVFPKLWTQEQRAISHLSLAHIVERAYSVYFPLIYDWKPHLGEKIEYLQETLYEVRPTFFHGVPRIWEKVSAQIIVGIESSSNLKKTIYDISMKIGWKFRARKWSKESIPYYLKLLYWMAYQICFRHILHRMGLNNAEYVISTGAPLPPQIQKIWQIWGLDLINQYGSTETSGIISSQKTGFPYPGDLGQPLSINQIKLADDGEIMICGPGVFSGYWEEQEKTDQIFQENWLCMGEIFEYTQGNNLKMIDRKKDIMVTLGGKNLSPTYIENSLEGSPYISKAIVFADGRKFPCALIEIDFETVAEWARRNKVLYASFTSLTENKEVYQLISEEINKGNQVLARVEQVKKFRIIPQELDPEAGETTPTRKIKRALMYTMFGHLVEEMYVPQDIDHGRK